MPEHINYDLEEYIVRLLENHVNNEHSRNLPITSYKVCHCVFWRQARTIGNRLMRKGRKPRDYGDD